MRIIHTGDWHLGKYLEGHSRLDEQEIFLQDFIDLVEAQNADLVIIAGDIFDSFSPPARAETLFYDALPKISGRGKRLVVVISGNHDSPERLEAIGPLARSHGILIFGNPKSDIAPGAYGSHEVVASHMGAVEIAINGERAVLVAIPFPSEKRLNEVLYTGLDSDVEKLESYEERMKQLFDDVSVHYREDTINLLTTHLFVMGSEESGSERSIQLGGSYLINSAILPKEAQYIALGHVHKPQIVPGSQGRARYSGSPLHYNRTEINFIKSVVTIDVVAGSPAQIQLLPLKVYKPIEVWRCTSFDQALARCTEEGDRTCWVYLEIETQEYIKEDQIKALKDLKRDILGIKPITALEIKEEALREAHETQSFELLFKAFYQRQRGTEVSEETFGMLMNLVMAQEEDDQQDGAEELGGPKI